MNLISLLWLSELFLSPALEFPVPVCRSHELMSVKMIDHIVETHHIDVDPEMLKRAKVIVFLKTVFRFANGL